MEKENTLKVLFTYWKEGLTLNYVNFEGRARRREYWGYFFFQFLIGFTLGLLSLADNLEIFNKGTGTNTILFLIEIVAILYMLFSLPANISAMVLRLHDTNRSGWWLLLFLTIFIPVIKIIGTITLIVFLCLDGYPGPNKYGEDPKGRNYPVKDQESSSDKNVEDKSLYNIRKKKREFCRRV